VYFCCLSALWPQAVIARFLDKSRIQQLENYIKRVRLVDRFSSFEPIKTSEWPYQVLKSAFKGISYLKNQLPVPISNQSIGPTVEKKSCNYLCKLNILFKTFS
jgi:hypothetical protein